MSRPVNMDDASSGYIGLTGRTASANKSEPRAQADGRATKKTEPELSGRPPEPAYVELPGASGSEHKPLSLQRGRRGAFALVLVRHGESVWNAQRRFTGWTDVDLTQKGEHQAKEAGKLLASEKWEFDLAFGSLLRRSIRSLWLMLEALDQAWIPIFTDWRLNERHYGDLTGHTHNEVLAMHGTQHVLQWRRSFSARPPAMPYGDPRDPRADRRYRRVADDALPLTESLSDTTVRVSQVWNDILRPSIHSGMRILVCAHGNSVRALVKLLDNVPDAEIAHLDIPNGVPLVYWFDSDVRPLARCFLDLPHAAESNIL